MVQKTVIAIIMALLLIPAVHADIVINDIDVKANLLYESKKTAGGYTLPLHFSEHPFLGGEIVASTPDGLSAGIYSVYNMNASHQPLFSQSAIGASYTTLFVETHQIHNGIEVDMRHMYTHANMSNMDFFKGDLFETAVKAGMRSGIWYPYAVAAVVLPARIPVQRSAILGGVGLMTNIHLHKHIHFVTDSSVITSLFTYNQDLETMLKFRAALEVHQDTLPIQLKAGFNLFRDLKQAGYNQMGYNTKWDVTASYAF